jgi:alkylation response protein AidB-like acyl-CoA dehydrogenase
MTNLLYTETEEALRESVRALLTAHCPAQAVLARIDGPASYDDELWRRLVALGVTGLAVPEKLGGAGASFREVAVVAEELGRAVAPVVYLGSAVVATRALLAAGETELLSALAAGESTAALAVSFATGPGPLAPAAVAGPGGLSGRIPGVADALGADSLLVPAPDGLYEVPTAGPGVTQTPVVSLDATRPLCDVLLEGAPGRRIADGTDVARVVRDALTAGAAVLAAEQVGISQWCLDTTVEYVRTRRQFGRPVGSFQAVKHRLADVWVGLTEARAVSRFAADCLATDDPDLPVVAALAQAYCGPVAVSAAQECVQLHGGIGFTWEHPAHLYLKRAKSAAIGYGTAGRHRAALAVLVDLPG